MTHLLFPSLGRIEQDLFGPEFIPSALDPELVDTARPPCAPALSPPPYLLAMMERRVAADQAYLPEPPAVGQIRRVTEVRQADGQLRRLGRSCAILLGHGAGGRHWGGWMVAQESDWASDRDLVLQEDDGVLAPEAAMVQTWNPVEVELRGDEAILGKLSAARLEAVSKLSSHIPTDQQWALPRPGRIGAWDLDRGTTVVSGTPLGGAEDPRSRYQTLYRALAAELGAASQASRNAAAVPARPAQASWIDWLRSTFVKPAWTFGIAGLAVFQAIVLVSGGRFDSEPDLVYRSAAPAATEDPCRARIRLMFKVDTPYADVVIALRRVDARLISGPSETGEIWVLPPVDQDPDEIAAMLRQSHLIERSDVVHPEERQCKR